MRVGLNYQQKKIVMIGKKRYYISEQKASD
jgi:hypothetical protein